MAIDTRTEAEKRYDAERSGAAYVKPAPGSDTVWAPILDITDNPTNDGKPHEDEHILIAREADRLIAAEQTDTPLTPEAEEIIGILFGKPVPLVRSRDAAHRQERFIRILERISDMPEPAKSEAIRFMEGLIDGMPIGRAISDDDAARQAALPSAEAQIAAITPHSIHESITILDMELPTGESITRTTLDGAPADWINVTFGDAELVVKDNGQIVGVGIGDHYDDDISLEELRDLRTLLVNQLDRIDQLAALADMGPDVAAAREAWSAQSVQEERDLSETIGFGAWYQQWAKGCRLA